MFPKIELALPDWIAEEVAPDLVLKSDEEKMAFVIRLSELNVAHQSGGPFAAAVFEIESGRLVAPGVNVVVPAHCSLAHAEAMAIMVAQQVCQTFDLSHPDLPAMELVSSSQPCIQCFGNLWWSGLQRMIIGASNEDVERLTGFEEGPLPDNWVSKLENRLPLAPVHVRRHVLRDEACAALQKYRDSGAVIYNAGATQDQQAAAGDAADE